MRVKVVFIKTDDELLGLEPEAVVQELWRVPRVFPLGTRHSGTAESRDDAPLQGYWLRRAALDLCVGSA